MVTPEELSSLALALPEAHERPAWGRTCFRVKDKIFASMSPDGVEVAIKVAEDERLALVAGDPDTFSVPPHYQNWGMVVAQLDTVQADELGELLTEAWRMTAPKRLLAAFDTG
ncbi:MmcQ/YjbR family DNA-binding protein [Crossiella sp. CA198]|uniref:MmcQ/YjbR family DNA-binding protein n=1 Tax=Crossiella sp. CA198 TaxID=3455607 RepID=UPI003F8D01D6